jgi:hypothetical protein
MKDESKGGEGQQKALGPSMKDNAEQFAKI